MDLPLNRDTVFLYSSDGSIFLIDERNDVWGYDSIAD